MSTVVGTDMWVTPRVQPVLLPNEVHVWRAFLDCPDESVELAHLLSESERKRAERFFFNSDRERFIVAHGVLRLLLGRYLGCQFEFSMNAFGKPELAGHKLSFNLSHSRSVALFAFACDREVGVDLEYVDPQGADAAVARMFFSSEENVELEAMDTDRRVRGFFNCWTRKEAYIKASGRGLSLPLHEFRVSIGGSLSPVLVRNVAPTAHPYWSVRELLPETNYVGAVATTGFHWQLRTWQVSLDS